MPLHIEIVLVMNCKMTFETMEEEIVFSERMHMSSY